LFSAALLLPWCASDPARAAEPDINTQIVDALNKVYGKHPGFRANHAKGIVVEGTFTPGPDGAALSTSPLFRSGTSLPVTVRFSDAGGRPDVPDNSAHANPHGMSIKFHLPDRDSDIVVNALKFFPVATPEDFRDLQLGIASSPPGGPPSSQLQEFLKSHPRVKQAGATLSNPASFAEEQYHGINAFIFVDDKGRRQPFRYILSPSKVVYLDSAAAAAKPPNHLLDELRQRIASAPVIFRLRAQLAAPGDQTHDATLPWPENRKIVGLGVLTLTRASADSDAEQKKLLFLPGRLTEGIEASDDPLIRARDAAYAISFGRRSTPP
jgi:catalase